MSVKILVADESPTIHKIVAMAFEDEGFTVEGISRGEHVMEYMVEFQPNIVLTDIHLPGIDGYELCRQIKNFASFEGVRVILLTSDFEDIDKLKLEVSKADDFISKPFKTEEILNKVKSQLKIPEIEKKAPVKDTNSPEETEKNEVIQKELEDIINQSGESASDLVHQFFNEGEDLEPSINAIDLESDTPSKQKTEKSREEKTQDGSTNDEMLPEIAVDPAEDTIHAETRPIKIKTDDLNSVFQSVLSSPVSELEDSPKVEPGSKPNLIEETLSLLAHTEGNPEIMPTLEPVTGEILQGSTDLTDHSLGDKIVKEHMDQVKERLPEDMKHEKSHAVLEKTVREVLGEVAPKIIREVIQKEIETIKKMKEA